MPSMRRRRAAGSTICRAATLRRSPAREECRATRTHASLIMDLALEEPELRECDASEQREEHHRECPGIGGIPEPEPDLVDVVEKERGCVVRAAARHHDDVIDEAKRIDHGVHEHEE